MTKFFLLILLASCATAPSRLPPAAVISSRKFTSAQEAGNYIKNRNNYLRMLFEQSRDPYYGTPKWPEECLNANRFGKVEEKGGNSFFFARLLLDQKNEPGDCRGKPNDVIYLHCKDSTEALEVICPAGTCEDYLSGNPCPLRQ